MDEELPLYEVNELSIEEALLVFAAEREIAKEAGRSAQRGASPEARNADPE